MQSLVGNSWTHCWPVNKNKNSYFRGNTKDGLVIPSVWMGARAWACVCADARSKPLPTSCRRDASALSTSPASGQSQLRAQSLCDTCAECKCIQTVGCVLFMANLTNANQMGGMPGGWMSHDMMYNRYRHFMYYDWQWVMIRFLFLLQIIMLLRLTFS